MSTSMANDTTYQHLEPRPGSNYRQMFQRPAYPCGRGDEWIHGPDPLTPEEFAREFQVSMEAIREGTDYVGSQPGPDRASGTAKPPTSGPVVSTGPGAHENPHRRESEQRPPCFANPGGRA